MIVAAVVACTSARPVARPAEPTRAREVQGRFALGPPEHSPADDHVVVLRSVDGRQLLQEDAIRQRSHAYTPVRVAPPLERDALGGRDFRIGYRGVAWVINGHVMTGFELLVDLDGDGDLAEEVPVPMRRDASRYTALVRVPAYRDSYGPGVVQVVFDEGVHVGTRNVRYGVLRDPALRNPYRFRISGLGGLYGLPTQSLEVLDPSGQVIASAHNRERHITLEGRILEFHVSQTGDVLDVRQVPKRTGPPRLRAGERMASLEVRALDGRRVRIGRRGEAVLLSFFSLGCPPCIAELPRLRTLAARTRLVSVASDDPRALESFAIDHGISWPIIHEALEDGPLGTMFRVTRFPTHVYIDESGRIRCIGCSLDELDELVPKAAAP